MVFKAHRRLYHSTLGLRVIKKTRRMEANLCCDVESSVRALPDPRLLCLDVRAHVRLRCVLRLGLSDIFLDIPKLIWAPPH